MVTAAAFPVRRAIPQINFSDPCLDVFFTKGGLLNLGIGLITPPVGPTLFVGCAIGKVTIEQVTKELWPFYGAMCVALLLVTYIPAISLWLPGLMK